MTIFKLLTYFSLILPLIFSYQARAFFDSEEEGDVRLSGFGSLFVTHAGADDLGYYRDLTHFPQTKTYH